MTRPTDSRARLALVRHAESTWVAEGRFQGRSDPPLSGLGQRQASLLGGRLRAPHDPPALPLPAGPATAIWYSPLERAAATARVIAEAIPSSIVVKADAALVELGQGEWEGLTHAEVRAGWASELDAWRRSPWTSTAPGGESLRDAEARIGAGLDRMVAQLGAAPVPMPWAIVVSHDGVLRLALMRLLGVTVERFWSFPFPVGGITIVEVGSGGAGLLAHGLIEHLAGLESGPPLPAPRSAEREGVL